MAIRRDPPRTTPDVAGAAETPRKPYRSPELVAYGSLRDLTRSGAEDVVDAGFGGSGPTT
jgi:hypothetical protein